MAPAAPGREGMDAGDPSSKLPSLVPTLVSEPFASGASDIATEQPSPDPPAAATGVVAGSGDGAGDVLIPSATNPVSRVITVQAAAGDLTFNLELDGNANASAPASYVNGWVSAANMLSAAIPDPITINLEIGYTEYPGDNSSEKSGGASAAPA